MLRKATARTQSSRDLAKSLHELRRRPRDLARQNSHLVNKAVGRAITMSPMGLCAVRLAYRVRVFGAVNWLTGVGTPQPSGNFCPIRITPRFLRRVCSAVAHIVNRHMEISIR